MNSQTKKQKRLVIDIPLKLHNTIKGKANDLGLSIKSYVLLALVKKEEHDFIEV